jgi:hypothetical protein
VSRLDDILERLLPHERAEFEQLLANDPARWRPLPGPQTEAYESEATIVGYGGAAGGGKSDLAVGLALTRHRRVGFFRNTGTELTAIIDRFAEVLGTRDGFNGKDNIWRTTRTDGVPVQIELGSFPNVDDEKKQQGRARDLLIFDECSNMREIAVRYVLGWLRTTDPEQRCRALLTFNPPTSVEGRWVIAFFAPWLDRKHPRPAKPGELRWFATIDGRDVELESGAPFQHQGETIVPTSRTFIPSRLSDNPFLSRTGYGATLQSLPEPLRSQMLHGDFAAGMEDDPWQVIPTAWVEAAQARWTRPDKLPPMDSLGVDVARGGRDSTIIARRHGMWFDVPLVHPGSSTPDGPTVAGLVVTAARDRAVIHIDVIGVGSSPFDFLNEMQQQVIGVNVAEAAHSMDKSGRLRFKNLRSQLWWRMREALDPANNTGICLPPDSRLLADLCAPTWKLVGQEIQVASRDEIIARIGRSPDWGSAYCLALIETVKIDAFYELQNGGKNARQTWDPLRRRGGDDRWKSLSSRFPMRRDQ